MMDKVVENCVFHYDFMFVRLVELMDQKGMHMVSWGQDPNPTSPPL